MSWLRSQHKAGALSAERVCRLESLGFEWDVGTDASSRATADALRDGGAEVTPEFVSPLPF